MTFIPFHTNIYNHCPLCTMWYHGMSHCLPCSFYCVLSWDPMGLPMSWYTREPYLHTCPSYLYHELPWNTLPEQWLLKDPPTFCPYTQDGWVAKLCSHKSSHQWASSVRLLPTVTWLPSSLIVRMCEPLHATPSGYGAINLSEPLLVNLHDKKLQWGVDSQFFASNLSRCSWYCTHTRMQLAHCCAHWHKLQCTF